MLLSLLVVLLGIATALVFLGYYSKERAYSLVGFSFFFILGFWSIMAGGIDYASGELHNYTYTANDTINTIEITDQYTNVTDNTTRFFGVWLALFGALGAAITTAEIRKGVI